MSRSVIPLTPAEEAAATSTASPNIAGFNEAMGRLHAFFDTAVVFHIPAEQGSITYPDDTAFDDETGLPMDPLVEPTSGGGESDVVVDAGVVHRPGTTADESSVAAAGLMESVTMVLLLLPDAKAQVEGATHVTVYEERQKITEWRPDGAFGGLDRWLVYLEGV